MKFVVVAYVRGRWVWLKIIRRSAVGALLSEPFFEWSERPDAAIFESKSEAQQWAPPGAAIMAETWAPRSARMGKET